MIICFQLHKLTWWTRHHKQDPEVDDDGEQQPEEGKQGTGDEITNDHKDKEIAIGVSEDDEETTSTQGKRMVGLCSVRGDKVILIGCSLLSHEYCKLIG